MKAFWRDTKLNEGENILLEHLFDAHYQATFRENASSSILQAAYQCNGEDFTKAAAAALCSLGGLHAPIIQTCEVLGIHQDDMSWHQNSMYLSFGLDYGEKIPGWGSSFVKGIPDPVVDNVLVYIEAGWSWMARRINAITDMLHNHPRTTKIIFPNMACITAATGVILGMPKNLVPALLLHGRSLAWAEILHGNQSKPTRQVPTP